MSKITTNTDWCDIDQLDGKDLEPNELLEIKFPNGVVERHIITVIHDTFVMPEMGRNYTAPRRKAYITINYNRCDARIKLAGLEAKRI